MPTTPSQTVGPFFAIELPYGDGRFVVREGTADAIWLRGRVLDGEGVPATSGASGARAPTTRAAGQS
jgi:protocatechuate 3,4-dioxygenase, alpha subunit